MRPLGYGSAYHIERAIALRQGFGEYPCACRRCCGGRVCSTALVAAHHRKYGRDPFLRYPLLVRMQALSF